MASATDTVGAQAVGEKFVAALGRLDWDGLQSCFTEDVQFRALIPPGLREGSDAAAAAGYFKRWFGDSDQLVPLGSEVKLVADRLAIRYRFRAHEDQWYVVEQQVYCDVRSGRIERMELLCSGFRPV